MKNLLLALLLSFSLPFAVQAEELTSTKKALIDELLQITNTKAIARGMMQQAIAPALNAIQKNPNFQKPGLIEELTKNINSYMNREMIESNMLNEVAYVVYHRHFTLTELQEVMRFYRTPIGAKMAQRTPVIARESIAETQKRTAPLKQGIVKVMQDTVAKYQ